MRVNSFDDCNGRFLVSIDDEELRGPWPKHAIRIVGSPAGGLAVDSGEHGPRGFGVRHRPVTRRSQRSDHSACGDRRGSGISHRCD